MVSWGNKIEFPLLELSYTVCKVIIQILGDVLCGYLLKKYVTIA